MKTAKTGTVNSKIKRGDQVVFVAGKEYNRYDSQGKRQPYRGKVIEVDARNGKVKVEGAMIIKRHTKPVPQLNREGGIKESEAWVDISNIALIDELQVEFDNGLNLLTGETGSGKSIIVDALGVLIGGRFTADLLKSGAERGFIEGLFSVTRNDNLHRMLSNAGLLSEDERVKSFELIIRREVSASGKNKIFINNKLATLILLRELREYLVDIHGQGEQQTLFKTDTHLELLDSFAGNSALRTQVATAYAQLHEVQSKLDELNRNEAEKFQLVDTLTYQIEELERTHLVIGEDIQLEDEKRRLTNVEKLTSLSQSSYGRIYEDDDSALARVRQATSELVELSEFEPRFAEYLEGLESARAVLEDLSFSLRDFADRLEF